MKDLAIKLVLQLTNHVANKIEVHAFQKLEQSNYMIAENNLALL